MSKLAVLRRLPLIACMLTLLLAAPAARAAGTFFIRGGGYGHGIGLSQYGAGGLAAHGKDFRSILTHYYSGTAIGHVDPRQIVRVLLKGGAAAFSGATTAGAQKLHPELTYTIKALADGSLKLLDPNGKAVGRFPAPLTVSGPGPLNLAGLGAYRGALEFRPDGAGGVQTVDAVGIDDYVRGVIAAEMPAAWPAQALAAQAVAARTYAITTSVSGNGYTLYPDTRSQMYGGVAAETASTDAAVAATSGDVVTYAGQPVATPFFASSGGYTENVENVWSGATPEPWLRGVRDPYDDFAGDPYHRWAYNLSPANAARRLGALVKGRLLGIRVTRHGASPRILTAQVVGTKGVSTVSGATLQRIFGLPTTLVRFVMVNTAPGLPAPGARDRTRRLSSGEYWKTVLAGALSGPRGLHGFVLAGGRHATVTVQEQLMGGWVTVTRARVRASGAYAVRLSRAGRFRVVYLGLDGPAIDVS